MTQHRLSAILLCAVAVCGACRQGKHWDASRVYGEPMEPAVVAETGFSDPSHRKPSGRATPSVAAGSARQAAPAQRLSENRPRQRGQAHFAPRTAQNEPVPDGFRILPVAFTQSETTSSDDGVQFELLPEPSGAAANNHPWSSPDSLPENSPPPADYFTEGLSPTARAFYGEPASAPEPGGLGFRLAVMREHCCEDVRYGCHRLLVDHCNYYSWNNLGMLAVGFGLGAAVANTDADQNIQDWYQDDVRGSVGDDFARWTKIFGEGYYVAAASVAGLTVGEIFYDCPIGWTLGDWGGRTLRSTFVGVPPLLLMQSATGASRPGESSAGSDWKPFDDDNGVSGHAFMGALPFINAAKMSDRPVLKVGFYACSFLPAWSRVNDDSHYMSQSLLGWWMAYCAATAVDLTNRGEQQQWTVTALPVGDGTGMGMVYRY